MDNNTFLLNFQKLQYGLFYDKIIDIGFSTICWVKEFDWPSFNYAQVNNLINIDQLKIIEKNFLDLDRQSAIYFENKPELDSLKVFLEKNNYKKTWEDTWMFHSGENLNFPDTKVVKVENEIQLKDYLLTVDMCYQEDDPQNPYGLLGAYLTKSETLWYQNHQSNKLEFFVFYKDDKPVAVSALQNYNGIGYISGVGSIREVRGQGFGKIASLYSVKKSIENGNTLHCLATEEGQYPYEFYKRIGFVSRFTACGYTLET